MLLSIITLNYKKAGLTINCIESLYRQFGREFGDSKLELIVIDNASDDGSAEDIEKEIRKKGYKNIKLYRNATNLGFSKGCNIGAERAKGDLLLFLNNDTQVRDRGIVDMADYFEKNAEVDILGGKLSNADGSEQPSVGKFYTSFNAFLFLLGVQRFGVIDKNPTRISKVDWVKGGLLMIKQEVFKKLRGFDEKIFMYTEDMELCYRAKKSGYKVFFYPDISIIHIDQGSSDRTYAIVNIYKNLLYFNKKHKSYAEYLFLKIILRTKAAILIFIGRLSDNSYLVQTYEKALKMA